MRFDLTHAFTAEDLAEGSVVFKAVAEPSGVRDAVVADNAVIAPATVMRPAAG
ncbi:hypothetical protein [Actinokineospora bangkokensis]|uniref:hypothetical protein n=1 Tax=Actinokineospora bangkokensis TaxID=1193682 RepID=UPI000A48D2B0|nr:hypothetical protein [Actinokineospora bangkokensis]